MRVLTVGSLYPPHHLGGYELVWQAAVRALREAGHEVRVLATSDQLSTPRPGTQEPDVHRDLRWYWHDHRFPPLSLRARLALERHNQAVLRRHLAEQRPDLVSWWSMGGMSLSLVEQVRLTGPPALGWVNDGWLVYGPQVDQWLRGWDRFGRAATVARALSGVPVSVDLGRAARWIFCSEAMRQPTLARLEGVRSSTVLHQGVASEFTPAAPNPWRGQLLYAGRLDDRKGLATLIEAVVGLPELTLRIVGDGDTRTRERLIDEARPAAGRIEFEARVARVLLAQRYAEADAVVFPVEWIEPWGLVPLEAMAVGRPVVATARGGPAEYLEHEGNALIFETGSVSSLQASLRRLAGDAGLREALRAGGFETAARLTEAAWTEGVVREHEMLAQRSGAGRG
jgi:glycogen synthase